MNETFSIKNPNPSKSISFIIDTIFIFIQQNLKFLKISKYRQVSSFIQLRVLKAKRKNKGRKE